MHIHITGIAGSLLAPLAVELKKQGHTITGSDKAFYPPASTLLVKNKIKIIPGFKPDKFKTIGVPDLAVMQAFLTPKNPEIVYLKNKKVKIISLGQLLEKFFIKKDSVVIAGSAGKTTITSMVAWIMKNAKMDPSIMVGGVMNNFKTGVKVGKSSWSVTEGDEFKNWHVTRNYKFTKKSRIHYQKAKYAIFTGAEWDHYDIYPTKKDYFNNFKKFVANIPKNGFLIGNIEGENVEKILKSAKCKTIYYGKKENKKIAKKNVYYYSSNIKFSHDGSEFEIWKTKVEKKELIGKFKLPMIGAVNIENATASIAMADQLGISCLKIKKSLTSFLGVKRRQEVRFDTKKYVVYDDFAHSSVKIRYMLDSFRKNFSKNKIITIYQPGSKDEKSIKEYTDKEFKFADLIILPHISSIKKESREFNKKIFKQLKKYKALKNKVLYIEDDNKLVKKLKEKIEQFNKKTKQKVVVIFAGQKGFRGMIEEVIK